MEHLLDYKNTPRFNAYARGASSRELSFELTKEQFETISNKNCYYCGKESPNGIDRVDSSKGYSLSNCVPACKHCNYAKGNLSQELFDEWVSRLINYQIKEKKVNE